MAAKSDKVYSQSGKYIGEHAPGSGGAVKQSKSNKVGRKWAGGQEVTKKQQYGLHGYGSVAPPETHPGQGSMDMGSGPGVNPSEFKPLSSWEGLSDKQRHATLSTLSNKYGVTPENTLQAHGALIDSAFDRSRAAHQMAHPDSHEGWSGSVRMHGQDFYSGGEESDRGQVAALARRHGVPFDVAAGVRGAVSPRIKLPGERRSAEAVFQHVAAGKGPQDKVLGAGIQGNARSGVEILRQHLEGGIQPTDAMEHSYGKSGEFEGQPRKDKKTGEPIMKKALSGPKVEGYVQSYTHPFHPQTRGAMDVHAVAGMTPHLPANPGKWTDPKDNKERMIPQSHPDWKANAEDLMKNVSHATEFFDHFSRQAAKQRGLTQPEGQAGAWFEQRGHVRGIQDAPVEKGAPTQPSLFNDRRR